MQKQQFNNGSVMSVAMAAATVLLACSWSFAQEKAAEDPYLQLAVARAKVEIAIRDSGPITENNKNGFDAVWQATDQVWTRTWEAMGKARDAENRKEENARSQPFIEENNGKIESLNRDWQTFNQKDRQELREKIQEAIGEFNTLNQAFIYQVQQEQNFKNAKLDLTQLVAIYGTMEKKVVEIRAKAKAVIEKEKAAQQNWEKTAATVDAFLTKAGYPSQKPAEKAQ
ncbi:MAG: hypothetical protein C0404_00690 [Verrucomicrobia bacterium]|nr:hypothetical protein [Verrucomicrobiota bacterium]